MVQILAIRQGFLKDQKAFFFFMAAGFCTIFTRTLLIFCIAFEEKSVYQLSHSFSSWGWPRYRSSHLSLLFPYCSIGISFIFTLINLIFPFSKWSYFLSMELNISQIFLYQLNFLSSSYGQSTHSLHYFMHHCISVDANAAASFLPSQPATPYFL